MRRLTLLVCGLLSWGAATGNAQTVTGDLSGAISISVGQEPGTVITGPGQMVVLPNQPPRDRRAEGLPGTAKFGGRVVDGETGAPLRRVMVRLNELGAREARAAYTDSDGQYEFSELRAGRYAVTFTKAGYVNWAYGQKRATEQPAPTPVTLSDGQVVNGDVALPRGAAITGRVVDEFGEPVADVMVTALRYAFSPGGPRPMMSGRPYQTNDIGEFRIAGVPPGDYLIAASSRFSAPFAAVSDDRVGYATVYYPGTGDPAQAQKLRVSSGQSVAGLTLTLIPARAAKVSGVVFDESGEVLRNGTVSAQAVGEYMFGGAGGQIRSDGTFTLNGLTPGTYVLRSMAPPMMMGPGAPPGPRRVSTATVTVNGEDLTGVRLEPQPVVQISGRIVVDPAAAASFRPQSARIMATPADPTATAGFMGPPQPPQPVRDDGTFTASASSGPFVVRAAGLPPGWIVRRVMWRGVDVTEKVDVPADGIDDLNIELTNLAPVVTGRVLNDRSEETKDFVALLFPQEEDLWTHATRQALGRPDAQGRFTIRTVPAGNYYLAAVEYLENGQSYDPAFLESIRQSATRVTLREGDSQSFDLRLTTPR